MSRKLLLFAVFFMVATLVSCSDSKKEKGDSDIINDDDVTDIELNDESDDTSEVENDIETPDLPESPDEKEVPDDSEDGDDGENDDTEESDEEENDIEIPDDSETPVCESGSERWTVCAENNGKLQKQICPENGQWSDSGLCVDRVATIVCTGLTKCYNNADGEIPCPVAGENFYGQDAQYALLNYCLERNYLINTETVVDNYSGLMWQKEFPATFEGCSDDSGAYCTQAEASNYCQNLSLATFDDWRLPTVDELETIVNYGKINPAADSTAFPGLNNYRFWTSSPCLSEWGHLPENTGWYVDFEEGFTYPQDINKYYKAKCVRGKNFNHFAEYEEFTVGEDTVVLDMKTGLRWTKKYPMLYLNWQGALNQCETMVYAGFSDWRLPNVNELKTIVNRTLSDPASSFMTQDSQSLWSSSSSIDRPKQRSWALYSYDGSIYYDARGAANRVFCVR